MKVLLLFLISLIFSLPLMAQTAVDGYKAYNSGDYKKAEKIIIPLAEKNDPIALNAIGNWYFDGIIRKKNLVTACDYFEKAANLNYPSAQFNFAECFGKFGGRENNLKNWRKWHTLAGNNGDFDSQHVLMNFYLEINTNEDEAIYWARKAAEQNSSAARMVLWFKGKLDGLPEMTIRELLCVIFKVMIMDKPLDKCGSSS